jgi:hypothetical protein
MREPEVEAKLRIYLKNSGYDVFIRSVRTGADITATKNGRTLLVEVKGDIPGHDGSPGTINVDVMPLLDQILMRKGQQRADDYAIAIRPIHEKLVRQALPCLIFMGIKVLIIDDSQISELGEVLSGSP